jgi:predicted secreted protein
VSLSLWIGTGFVAWWICWQLVQPFFWEKVAEGDRQEGHAIGAPAKPQLLRKMFLASLFCAVFLGIVWAVIHYQMISLELYEPASVTTP